MVSTPVGGTVSHPPPAGGRRERTSIIAAARHPPGPLPSPNRPAAGTAFPRARELAERALELEPENVEALTVLGLTRLLFDRDFTGADEVLERAAALGRGTPGPHWARALSLCARRRCDEAAESLRRARALDPLSLPLALTIGWVHAKAGRAQPTAEAAYRILELEPRLAHAHWLLGTARMPEGRDDAGLRALRQAARLGEGFPMISGSLGHALGRSGRDAEARELLGLLEEARSSRYVPPLAIAVLRAGLGDLGPCRESLVRGMAERDAWVVFLDVWPYFRPVRGEDWFRDLVARVIPDADAAPTAP